eukprot:TRINITY_DN33874_c0_g1_i1.p1 TRINITY_DN33874_c0_g1~~TRINITY_DN33874_c0_g1_i1.p1  ORF type:complete len:373 (+),score=30.84 TRINITY_DN33874_c0_g1_i1:24-1142(+)
MERLGCLMVCGGVGSETSEDPTILKYFVDNCRVAFALKDKISTNHCFLLPWDSFDDDLTTYFNGTLKPAGYPDEFLTFMMDVFLRHSTSLATITAGWVEAIQTKLKELAQDGSVLVLLGNEGLRRGMGLPRKNVAGRYLRLGHITECVGHQNTVVVYQACEPTGFFADTSLQADGTVGVILHHWALYAFQLKKKQPANAVSRSFGNALSCGLSTEGATDALERVNAFHAKIDYTTICMGTTEEDKEDLQFTTAGFEFRGNAELVHQLFDIADLPFPMPTSEMLAVTSERHGSAEEDLHERLQELGWAEEVRLVDPYSTEVDDEVVDRHEAALRCWYGKTRIGTKVAVFFALKKLNMQQLNPSRAPLINTQKQ